MSNVTFGPMLKKTAAYAVGLMATRALSFVLIPLYTRYLTPTDYGVLELLDLTLNLTLVFAGSRLGQALFYYYFAEPDEVTRERHLSTNLLASMVLGAAAMGFCWFFSPVLSALVFGTRQYAAYFRLTSVAVGLAIPMETGLCCVRAFNEPSIYSGITILRTVVAGCINIVLLSRYGFGVAAMLWSSIVTQGIAMVYLVAHTYRRVPIRFDTHLFRLQAKYTVPMTVGSLGEFVLNYGDRYFLRRVVPLSEIGIYSLAYKIGMLIPLVQWPFALYWTSQEVKVVRAEGGWKIFSRVATYQVLGLTLVTVMIMLFVNPALKILVSPAFREAGKYAPWIALAYLIRAASGPPREVFVIEKRPEKEAQVVWMGTILCLAGYALLIPRFHLWGAVDATLGSLFCVLLISGYVSWRLRRVQYEYGRLAILIGAAIAVTILFAVLNPVSFWSQVATACGLTALFLVILVAARFFQKNEIDFVQNKVRRVLGIRKQAA